MSHMGILALGLAGCGAATVRFDDAQPGVDPGSGPGAGAYQVVVEARASLASGATAVVVTALDLRGEELDSADLEVNGVPLEPAGGGSWEGELDGYDRRLRLQLDGPDGVFHAAMVGPEPHVVEALPGPWSQDEPMRVEWKPSGASFVAVEATGPGRVELRRDKGAHEFEGNTLELYAITVEVERWEVLELTGAAPDSSFLVSYVSDLHRTVTEPGAE